MRKEKIQMKLFKSKYIKPGDMAYIPVGATPDGKQVISLGKITETILFCKDGKEVETHYGFIHKGKSVSSPFAFKSFNEAYNKGLEIKETEAAMPKPAMTPAVFAKSVSEMIEQTANKCGLNVKCGVIGPFGADPLGVPEDE